MGEKSEIWRVGRSRRGGSDGDGGDGARVSIQRVTALEWGLHLKAYRVYCRTSATV